MDDHDVRLKPMLFGRLSHFKKPPYGSHGAFSWIIYDDLPSLNIVDFTRSSSCKWLDNHSYTEVIPSGKR